MYLFIRQSNVKIPQLGILTFPIANDNNNDDKKKQPLHRWLQLRTDTIFMNSYSIF